MPSDYKYHRIRVFAVGTLSHHERSTKHPGEPITMEQLQGVRAEEEDGHPRQTQCRQTEVTLNQRNCVFYH